MINQTIGKLLKMSQVNKGSHEICINLLLMFIVWISSISIQDEMQITFEVTLFLFDTNLVNFRYIYQVDIWIRRLQMSFYHKYIT